MQDLTRTPHKFIEVPLGDMVVSEHAQRGLKPARVAQILSRLDLDAFGEPILSYRDGRYYIIDGQHRIKAMAEFLGDGWERAAVMCKVYEGMDEKQEAELFIQINTVLASTPYDKFKIGVTAGREEETKIKQIVEALGLHISRGKSDGGVSAVGALRRAYGLSPKSLMFALKLATESFGNAGLEGAIIEGLAHLHNRYTAALDDEVTIEALSHVRGGVKGLLNSAQSRRLQIGNSLPICIAAECVDVINRHRKSKKLPSWWATAAA
jgi:hypothetical protein